VRFMQRTITLIFAVLFAVIGLAAFVPALAPANADGQLLLYIFQINIEQTYIHLLTAVVAAIAYFGGSYYAKTYLIVFGIVYALVALWGLPAFMGTYNGVLFGLIHVNLPTELLHIAIAALALYGGFSKAK
jgi:hypothetical protein